MAFEELVSELTLDASDFESGSSSASGAADDLADATDTVEEGLFDLDPAGAAAGVGIAAIGGAITGVVEDTKGWRESLGRTRTTMGLTSEEANDLARSISNATFPMDDAVGTMDSLARQGVETEEEMQNVAAAADMVADATGTTATSVAENAVPALRAMGQDASDLEDNMDAFTFIARNTTMSVEDFSRVVTKTGPEIQEMGLSVDDTATIMAALEERGLDSRTAMREFRQAARDADGDQQQLIETLGLSEEELGAQADALADSEGATQEYAEAANESVTTLDRLRQGFDEAKLAAGGLLGPVDAAGPALMGLGGALSTVSAINFGAVIPSLLGVMGAIAPILPILLAVAAGAALLWKAWDSNFLGIQNVTEDALGAVGAGFDWLTGKVGDAVEWIIDAVFGIPDAVGGVIDALPGIDSEDILGDVDRDKVMGQLFPPKPGEEAEEIGEDVGEGVAEGTLNAVTDTPESPVEAAVAPDDADGGGPALSSAALRRGELTPSGGAGGAPALSSAALRRGELTPSDGTDAAEAEAAPSTGTSSAPGMFSRGPSASDLASAVREALTGLTLDVDGEFDAERGIIEIVDARLLRERRTRDRLRGRPTDL